MFSNLAKNVVCHLTAPFIFFSSVSCICTNAIYTSNAPKLFCGCQQPNTLCVCEWGNSPVSVCVVYRNVALYSTYVKPEGCWHINKIRARVLQSSLADWDSVIWHTCEQRQTLAKKLSENKAFWSVKPASVCYSCLHDVSSGWRDHSSALYC